jgi:hypothetical protein
MTFRWSLQKLHLFSQLTNNRGKTVITKQISMIKTNSIHLVLHEVIHQIKFLTTGWHKEPIFPVQAKHNSELFMTNPNLQVGIVEVL